mmetsp:Transcript_38004/g.98357  ORF Transcript_38004/g.98357 Transcript_38004/m.98357 type:complete len:282 (-) Transcript_38004:125-970(-)
MAAAAPPCLELAPQAHPHPFEWEAIERDPKIPRTCLTRLHKTMEYEILHTGGFVRLCTERGRVYWLAQNEHDHRLPDWKVHISVQPEDVSKAWNVLTRLFVEEGCDFGMKAVAGEALASWPRAQRGREITIYIFQHDPAYINGGPMVDLCPPGAEHRFWLGPEFERDAGFWSRLIGEGEQRLQAAGVRNHGGFAHGDLPLSGRYASVRNEAFVLMQDAGERREGMSYIYPPNHAGWNAAGHPCPLTLPWRARWRAAASRMLRRPGVVRQPCCRRLAHRRAA